MSHTIVTDTLRLQLVELGFTSLAGPSGRNSGLGVLSYRSSFRSRLPSGLPHGALNRTHVRASRNRCNKLVFEFSDARSNATRVETSVVDGVIPPDQFSAIRDWFKHAAVEHERLVKLDADKDAAHAAYTQQLETDNELCTKLTGQSATGRYLQTGMQHTPDGAAAGAVVAFHVVGADVREIAAKVNAVQFSTELLEALKRIRRTSVEETFGGDVHRFQEWLDGFTGEIIGKVEGSQ